MLEVGRPQRARKVAMKTDTYTRIKDEVIAPLRVRGLLAVGPPDKATPERIVALAVERIASQAKEIERLREVNAKVLASVESAPGSGLRKRLKAAQEAKVDAEQRHEVTLSYLRAGHELMNGYRADIKTLSTAIANAIKESPDLPPAKLAEALTAKWKLLALDEVAQRADDLANAVFAAVKTYARTSL